MAVFSLSLFNHGDGRSYLDIISNIRAMLLDLGHHFVLREDLLPPPAINLVMEGFDWPSFVRLQQERNPGKRLVMIVTEMPTRPSKRGFLWGHRINGYWSERAYAARLAMPLFDACWCLVAGASETLKPWQPNCFDVELGFSPQLLRPLPEPDHDFVFFGSLNARRQRMVDEFRRRGHSVAAEWDMPIPPERDRILARGRVALDLKIFDWWPVVSSSRIQTCLHAGRPIICEARGPGMTQHGWTEIVPFADGDFIEAAASMLPRWREAHAEQLAAFSRLNAPAAFGAAVMQTLGIMRGHPRIVRDIVYDAPPWAHGPPRLIKSIRGVNLVLYRHRIYRVPQSIGPIEIDKTEHPAIRVFNSLPEAEAAI